MQGGGHWVGGRYPGREGEFVRESTRDRVRIWREEVAVKP